ncbi:cytochrome P450 [Suillus tomentosus]|nr:cytochrome P450 [Suillus tomentosus]
MAAATHTDAQTRVQEELDNVVGHTRPPTFANQEMLPQVTAFILEGLRWRPVTIGGRVRGDLKFFTFGFGRRVCPGQHVANRSIFINTAVILWAFRLSENPAAKIDTLAISNTATVHAAPFEICLEKRIDENVIRELCAPGK